MIISREYIPFRTLIDKYDKGGELFIKLCKEAYPKDMWERAYLQLSDFALYQREMEWGFHKIADLVEGFRELDESEPYDTGYDLHDAQTADILWSSETTMTLLLRTGEAQGREIVGLIEIDTAH